MKCHFDIQTNNPFSSSSDVDYLMGRNLPSFREDPPSDPLWCPVVQ